MDEVDNFIKERESLNETVMRYANLEIKRFFSLDYQIYKEGKIPKKYKELMGLVASTVLRCDDCIKYHILQSKKEGASDEEFIEALSIALVIGGSITIPHIRRAVRFWDELKR